ncbi:hypothetical protein AVEN_50872-1 [Araneus ventricosus]|uniref:Uncharacterized protein n=1 Tax=Araneus ventricosus TaxID=182803 RepID=A0A4Y2M908_ARAVE|nr:hypothetical protein AVEN_50872-1 [Araneus ventricosus]
MIATTRGLAVLSPLQRQPVSTNWRYHFRMLLSVGLSFLNRLVILLLQQRRCLKSTVFYKSNSSHCITYSSSSTATFYTRMVNEPCISLTVATAFPGSHSLGSFGCGIATFKDLTTTKVRRLNVELLCSTVEHVTSS